MVVAIKIEGREKWQPEEKSGLKKKGTGDIPLFFDRESFRILLKHAVKKRIKRDKPSSYRQPLLGKNKNNQGGGGEMYHKGEPAYPRVGQWRVWQKEPQQGANGKNLKLKNLQVVCL